MDYWIHEFIKKTSKKDVKIIIVGAKNDLNKVVQHKDVQNLMKSFEELKYKYIETSSKTGYNINELFDLFFIEQIDNFSNYKKYYDINIKSLIELLKI